MGFDFGQHSGINYLVTDYVPGVTLDAKLTGRPLQKRRFYNSSNSPRASKPAHKEGMIHRDLKPCN
jgi:serine/threonine protein kinase